jgi:hypothetical protein
MLIVTWAPPPAGGQPTRRVPIKKVVELDPAAPLACTYVRRPGSWRGDLGGDLSAAPDRTGGAGHPGTAATKLVQSPDELERTLRADPPFTGTVQIPKDVSWNMTGRADIPLRSGVWLVGERGGPFCTRPTLYTDTRQRHQLFSVLGSNVHVEGIHFRGPANGVRTAGGDYVHAILVTINRKDGIGRDILVADNEFDEWTGAGVEVTTTNVSRIPGTYVADWDPNRPPRKDVGQIRIERNDMHHNAMDGGGYGAQIGDGAYATVMGNVFNYNRHAVASNGFAGSGYVARFNYVLQGGFKQDDYYNQHFDVHGTDDTRPIVGYRPGGRGVSVPIYGPGDGKSTGYGGSAGEYYEVVLNTIRGDQRYHVVKTRPSFMLRGTPTEGAVFAGNVDVHWDLDSAVLLKKSKSSTGIGEDHAAFNFSASENQFRTDTSEGIAAGDFDGDGRTDVFLASGTAWFVSRGGVEPWQFIHASTKRRSDLGFADMNNDGVTDVIWRAGDGKLGYLKSGTGEVLPLTTTTVAIGDLRFGDFDGDGTTDIFMREPSGQWQIWYGNTRAWKQAQSSPLPLSELAFGQFDSARGTDVLGALGGGWAVSSGAAAPWGPGNPRLKQSLKGAVVADLDGDDRSDVLFEGAFGAWMVASGGLGDAAVYRKGDGVKQYKPLAEMIAGRFGGGVGPGREEKVAGFWGKRVQRPQSNGRTSTWVWERVPGKYLEAWYPAGAAGNGKFKPISRVEMK